MEIAYFKDLGFCCITQSTYIDNLSSQFLPIDMKEQKGTPTTPLGPKVNEQLKNAENEANFEGPYRQLVGGLLYLSV